ncbi:NADH:ubiquinone reductase (Na(+)-transporting) subunit C [Catalinimonas niigatensis]|uniref:NADH:ubiquinone reductase (Na(+)-transporting) subunit C n=1 Tax=Catalinimonas niigatensis TaxID=1397264 RepID=UPI0026668246|nr:NADH:ubiquinone reductase (Na(+)-transporting) subunit C [Catalinimonas niigatensis]WPP52455.1 NADH:ubiquinone reductase (Na(+)-transporting) subunit C [Catalinimonas niigatensis]
MRQSNTYIIVFSAVLTIILGGLLSLAAVGLKPMQDMQVALDTQKKILGAVMQLQPTDDVPAIYEEKIESLVVDANGEEVKEVDGEPIVAEKVSIESEFDKDPQDRLYPVYKYSEGGDQVTAYILPIFGVGLWDDIWGYIALNNDFETLAGIVLDHAGETPGLGARITSIEVQERFKGKKIYDDVGELVGIRMVKGETGEPSAYGDNEVDGLSGATITAKGVNNMISDYLNYYQPYLKKLSEGGAQASHRQEAGI